MTARADFGPATRGPAEAPTDAARGAAARTPGSARARPTRAVADVSGLPTIVFGSRDVLSWGTYGFMLVEGMTLAVCAAAFLYVRRNFQYWPPQHDPFPNLALGTTNLALLLASLVAYRRLDRAGKRLDTAGTRNWLFVTVLFGAATTALRFAELRGLGVRWDVNAYASTAWAILVAHGTLLLVDFGEMLLLALIFATGRHEPKHYTDASDNCVYSYFMVLAWVPLYCLVYVLPWWGR